MERQPRAHVYIAVAAGALVMAAAVVLALSSAGGPPGAQAVEAGLNCETYGDGVCVIEVGDIFFCDAEFQDIPCPSSVVAGETIRWEYPESGQLMHTVRECGADCDAPTDAPLWESGVLRPGDSFSYTFTTPGIYTYQCAIHPHQRGLLRVLEGEPGPTATPSPSPTPSGRRGDVNCDASVTSIDAALLLQYGAGLLRSLRCPQNADVNGDGATNAIDAALVLQYVAGLLGEL